MFLRVTPMTGVGRALKSKKLTPKFIGPYQISERDGTVAYRIGLPPHLSNLHDVFHVSQLRKYVVDPSHVIPRDDVFHSRQGEEERRHKINNNQIKREIIIRKTTVTIVFQE